MNDRPFERRLNLGLQVDRVEARFHDDLMAQPLTPVKSINGTGGES